MPDEWVERDNIVRAFEPMALTLSNRYEGLSGMEFMVFADQANPDRTALVAPGERRIEMSDLLDTLGYDGIDSEEFLHHLTNG